ncbi:MAG TPA: Flp pilus assembly protein CpaB [Pirellulales bacterium]|jgi:pilus assembly protein CpaB
MRPKSLILLLLALVCGLVAAIGINQVLASRPTEQAAEAGEMLPIFVALTDIGLGDPLTPEVLKLEEWPKSKVPAGALTTLEDVEGRRARAKFYGGEPIIEAKLLAKGDQGSGATDLIPKGYRVVSVKVDDVSGSGLILPGDRVDALVHLTDVGASSETNRSSTRTFLHNVKVFAVNNVYSRESNGTEAITAKTISLLVTPTQAELVTLASEMGKIRLVMRSADDDTQDDTVGVTQQELFKGGDMSEALTKAEKPSKENFLKILNPPTTTPDPVEDADTPVAPANTFKMLLIEGTSLREVEFEEGNRVGGILQIRQLNNPTEPGSTPSTMPSGFSLDQATGAAAAAAAAVPPYTPAKDDGPKGP